MRGMIVPDGYKPNLPLVEVSPDMVEAHGSPVVDYDGLEDMYHGHFAVPADRSPHLQLRALRTSIGRFNRITKVTKIDPTQTYEEYGRHGLTQVLLHEGQHFSDYLNHRSLYNREDALIWASALGSVAVGYFLGREAAELLKMGPVAKGLTTIMGPIAGSRLNSYYFLNRYLYDNCPTERRATETEYDEGLLKKYADVINFPDRFDVWAEARA